MKNKIKSPLDKTLKNIPKNKKTSKESIHPFKLKKSFSVENLPKNINDYKHILDDNVSSKTNVKFVLGLRHQPKENKKLKNLIFTPPSFYNDDLNKYQKRLLLKEKINLLSTNFAEIKFLLSDKTKCPINSSQLEYPISLRKNEADEDDIINKIKMKNKKKKLKLKFNFSDDKIQWDSTNFPKGKNLFDTLLPPLLDTSKNTLRQIQDKVSRPLIQVNKEGYVGGRKIRSRIFNYNNTFTLRYPGDSYPNSKYENDFGYSNYADIRHLFRSNSGDNTNTTSNWITYLRQKKRPKMSIETTKEREQKLKQLTTEKTYPKS